MNNLNLKSKLVLLVLMPVLGLLFLSLTISYDRFLIYSKLERLNKSVMLSIKTKSLIYSLQKERGLSNGYIGNTANSYKINLLQQKKMTTLYYEELNDFLKTIDITYYGDDFKENINKAIDTLRYIESVRRDTLKLEISEEDLNLYYTTLINSFIETISYSSNLSHDVTLNKHLNAYYNLLYVIERTANERGLGTLAFSSMQLSFEMRDELYSLISAQNVYMHNFKKNLDKESSTYFQNIFSGKIINESLRMRKVLLDKVKVEIKDNSEYFLDDSIYWFNTMTKKIAILQKMDSYLINQILEDTSNISYEAKRDMILYIILSIFILLAVTLKGRTTGVNIVNSVDELLNGIDRFFNFVNKESKSIEPIKIISNDEIGVIAKMINEKISISKKIIDEDIIERAKELELEVKRKTLDLKTKNQEYEILLDRFNKHAIATRTDTKGIITFVTDKFCKDSGYSKEELLHQNHNIVRHPDVPKSVYKDLWDTIQAGHEYSGELKNRRKDGSDYWTKLIIVPEYDTNNHIIGYFSVKENIDDKIKIREFNTVLEEKIKKAIEESRKKDELLSLQSKLASMGEMVGIIAHQWKQPLSSLSMRIQTLRYKKSIDEEYKKHFIDDNMELIDFMTKTIDDFRNFFRHDKKKDYFSMKECINKTLNILIPQLRQAKIHISIEGDDFRAYGIQSEFQQVIVNLISNARDALIEKEVEDKELNIIIKTKGKEGILCIQDNAKGIPEELIEKIFEPYYTTKGIDKGTGMGLYISKTIIEETMEGQLTVMNTQKGASFKITLPKP